MDINDEGLPGGCYEDVQRLYARGRKDTGDNYMLGHEWLRTDKKRTLRPGSYQRLDLFNELLRVLCPNLPAASKLINNKYSGWLLLKEVFFHLLVALGQGAGTSNDPFRS